MAATNTPLTHYGVTLSHSTTSGGSYTALTDIKLLTPPGIERGEVEITNLGSANMTKEFFPGWISVGELPFVAYFTDAAYTTFITTFLPADPQDALLFWKIQFTPVGADTVGASIIMPGFLKSVGLSEVTSVGDGVLEIPCTLKATGAITFTEGSAA